MRRCRAITSLSAEMGVSGTAGGQRLRGRVLVGLASPASALLDAAAPFGASLFLYAAHDGRATLLLPRDRRVLADGDPAAVLEAITGVPLGPADLRHALTACVVAGGDMVTNGRGFGADWRAVTVGDAEVYLRRLASGWRVTAILHSPASSPSATGKSEAGPQEWRADYTDFSGDLPRSVRLSTTDARRFNLRLALSQVEINPVLGREVFTVTIPAGVEAITLDELRRSGPMAERDQ